MAEAEAAIYQEDLICQGARIGTGGKLFQIWQTLGDHPKELSYSKLVVSGAKPGSVYRFSFTDSSRDRTWTKGDHAPVFVEFGEALPEWIASDRASRVMAERSRAAKREQRDIIAEHCKPLSEMYYSLGTGDLRAAFLASVIQQVTRMPR